MEWASDSLRLMLKTGVEEKCRERANSRRKQTKVNKKIEEMVSGACSRPEMEREGSRGHREQLEEVCGGLFFLGN